MKTQATHRLKASASGAIEPHLIIADSALHISDWWKELPHPEKKSYLEEHPNSKYAKQAIKEGEDKGFKSEPGMEAGSKQRKGWADSFRKATGKIAHEVKRTFPLMTNAVGAMGNLAQGKPLSHHQKEVLHELGHIVVKAGATHLTGDVNAGAALAKLGITAVEHAIDHFKEKKEQNPKKDDLETFIDGVADGVENAKEAPVPEEHAQPKSAYRSAVAKALKGAVHHTTSVVEKAFSNVKPAMTGLASLTQGKPLDEHQKHALKECGKYATATMIMALPGGIAAHLAAGAAVAATKHAMGAMKGKKVEPRELLGTFVLAIGEGLEHAAIHHMAGGHHGGEGGEHGGHGGGHEGGGHDSDMLDSNLGFGDGSASNVANHGLGFGDMAHYEGKGGGHGGGHSEEVQETNNETGEGSGVQDHFV